ncbi:hypothetical protein [Ferdinandcohnia quinoae]|uniref:hypothetical protein n=1 Tax=Fredinandcohnia quinoae TaxID=2918902 RepID=UPI003D66CDCB
MWLKVYKIDIVDNTLVRYKNTLETIKSHFGDILSYSTYRQTLHLIFYRFSSFCAKKKNTLEVLVQQHFRVFRIYQTFRKFIRWRPRRDSNSRPYA